MPSEFCDHLHNNLNLGPSFQHKEFDLDQTDFSMEKQR